MPIDDSSPMWLVVKTKPKQEMRARENLERQGFEIYLPMMTASKRLRGQWQKRTEPLFPGYLFLHANLQCDNLAPVRSTLGVANLVRFGHHIIPVPEEVIDFLRTEELRVADADGSALSPFSPGDKVQVLAGPFAGLTAIFQMAKGVDRAVVLISLLGRATGVVVPLDHVVLSD